MPPCLTPSIIRTYQRKHSKYNNKGEDNCLKTMNDKKHQASSKKFRQLDSNT